MPVLRLDFDQHAGGVFDGVFDALQKCHGFAAVDDAVVVGEGDLHHWSDDDLAFAGDGAVLDAVHAEHAALGWIDDGRGKQ